jgi:hypothetical protein
VNDTNTMRNLINEAHAALATEYHGDWKKVRGVGST